MMLRAVGPPDPAVLISGNPDWCNPHQPRPRQKAVLPWQNCSSQFPFTLHLLRGLLNLLKYIKLLWGFIFNYHILIHISYHEHESVFLPCFIICICKKKVWLQWIKLICSNSQDICCGVREERKSGEWRPPKQYEASAAVRIAFTAGAQTSPNLKDFMTYRVPLKSEQ